MENFLSSFHFNDKQIDGLKQYIDLIKDWNNKINLISFVNEEELIVKHLLDSIFLINFLELKGVKKTADLGTGGGFPGLALAILLPETEFILIDSTKKKLNVIDDVIKTIKLKNVKTLWGRLEDLAHARIYREKFDLVTARALAPLPTLLEYASGFIARNGIFAAYKGKNYKEELDFSQKAQKILNFQLKNTFQFDLPLNYGQRVILIFKKLQSLRGKYPRLGGAAKNKPLI